VLGKNLFGDERGAAGIWPAAIEGEVRDELDDLLALHAVVERAPQVPAQVVGLRERDERRNGDQAAITLRQARTLPDIAEYDLVGELAQLGKHVAYFSDGGWRCNAGSHANLLRGVVANDSIMQCMSAALPESPYAWVRLAASLALMTLGGVAMYGVVVALPAVQAEFGVARADASLPYTLTMIGFGIGGILMGALADRYGVIVPVVLGALGLGTGLILAGMSANILKFALAHGFLAGLLGCSATFAPLVADISLWFTKRRGIAVAICISGNYIAGATWPPLLQHFFDQAGWRATYIGVGIFSIAVMLPLAWVLKPRPPAIG